MQNRKSRRLPAKWVRALKLCRGRRRHRLLTATFLDSLASKAVEAGVPPQIKLGSVVRASKTQSPAICEIQRDGANYLQLVMLMSVNTAMQHEDIGLMSDGACAKLGAKGTEAPKTVCLSQIAGMWSCPSRLLLSFQ